MNLSPDACKQSHGSLLAGIKYEDIVCQQIIKKFLILKIRWIP